MNSAEDSTATPDDVPEPSQTNRAQDDFAEAQSQFEAEQRIWKSPEMTRCIQAVLNSQNEADRDVVAALQKMLNGLEEGWAAFEEWKELYIASETTPPVPLPDPVEETFADRLLKPYFHAKGRIDFLRRNFTDRKTDTTETDSASQSPRREMKGFAQQLLKDTLDRAEQKLESALEEFTRRFPRYKSTNDNEGMGDVIGDLWKITKEVNRDLLRGFDQFRGQAQAFEPYAERAMGAVVHAQSEALKQQAEKQAAQEAAKAAQDNAEASQRDLEIAREEEKSAQNKARLAQDEATAAKARADSAQINQDKAQDEAKLAQDRAKIAQDEAKVAEVKTKQAEDDAKTAHDKAADAWELMKLFYENGYPKLDFYPVEYFVKRHGSSSSNIRKRMTDYENYLVAIEKKQKQQGRNIPVGSEFIFGKTPPRGTKSPKIARAFEQWMGPKSAKGPARKE